MFAVDSPVDTAPPTASITAPAPGTTLLAPLSVTVDATDDIGVTRVELHVDGVLAGTDTVAPYAFTWNPGTAGDGSHALAAKAYDAAGNVATSASVPVTVAVPPAVSITAPGPGAQVSGTVTVSALASDNSGVVRVEFLVDGSLRATDTAAPYTFTWNTVPETPGNHTLSAVAYDAASLSTASAPVVVQVLAPLPPSPMAVYDPVLKAPRCNGTANSCDSGTLLLGRGTRGPEPNQPNTIANSCADGTGAPSTPTSPTTASR